MAALFCPLWWRVNQHEFVWERQERLRLHCWSIFWLRGFACAFHVTLIGSSTKDLIAAPNFQRMPSSSSRTSTEYSTGASLGNCSTVSDGQPILLVRKRFWEHNSEGRKSPPKRKTPPMQYFGTKITLFQNDLFFRLGGILLKWSLCCKCASVHRCLHACCTLLGLSCVVRAWFMQVANALDVFLCVDARAHLDFALQFLSWMGLWIPAN